MVTSQSICRSVLDRLEGRFQIRVAFLMLVIACLLMGFARLVILPTASNCQESAVPLITALERFHRVHGRYPATLDMLISGKFLPAIPRLPWTLGVAREGYEYEVEPHGDFYTLFYSEQDWFGGVGPAVVKGYGYYSAFKKWSREWVPPEIQALELDEQRFLSHRSSKNLRSMVSTLTKRFERVRWENVSKVLNAGRPRVVEGRVGVSVKASDADAIEYCFLPLERNLAGEIVQEVYAVYQFTSSGKDSTWQMVFHFRTGE